MGLLRALGRRAGGFASGAAEQIGHRLAPGGSAPVSNALAGGVAGGLTGAIANPEDPASGAMAGAAIGGGLGGGLSLARLAGSSMMSGARRMQAQRVAEELAQTQSPQAITQTIRQIARQDRRMADEVEQALYDIGVNL